MINDVKTIEGHKTIISPFDIKDMDLFVKLLRDNQDRIAVINIINFTDEEVENIIIKAIEAGTIKIWTAITKQGAKFRKIGFLYLTGITSWKANVHGMVDSQFLKDIGRQLIERYTYTEDAYRAFIRHCFNGMGLIRLETAIIKDNKPAWQIDKKVGFKIEGVLRKSVKIGEQYHDVVVLAILKEDFVKENN